MIPVLVPNQMLYSQDPVRSRINVFENSLPGLYARLNNIEEILYKQVFSEQALLHQHANGNQMRLDLIEHRLGQLERKVEEILSLLRSRK